MICVSFLAFNFVSYGLHSFKNVDLFIMASSRLRTSVWLVVAPSSPLQLRSSICHACSPDTKAQRVVGHLRFSASRETSCSTCSASCSRSSFLSSTPARNFVRSPELSVVKKRCQTRTFSLVKSVLLSYQGVQQAPGHAGCCRHRYLQERRRVCVFHVPLTCALAEAGLNPLVILQAAASYPCCSCEDMAYLAPNSPVLDHPYRQA